MPNDDGTGQEPAGLSQREEVDGMVKRYRVLVDADPEEMNVEAVIIEALGEAFDKRQAAAIVVCVEEVEDGEASDG